MAEKEETATIVTMRIEDEPHPAIDSQKGFVCNKCGEPVWIAPTSLQYMEGKYEICCNHCIVDRMLTKETPMEEWDMRACDPKYQQWLDENKEAMIGYMIARGLKDSRGKLRS